MVDHDILNNERDDAEDDEAFLDVVDEAFAEKANTLAESEPASDAKTEPQNQKKAAPERRPYKSRPRANKGKGKIRAKDGDCVVSKAVDHGFEWKTVWHHSENKELRDSREDPTMILAGDRITIPKC